MAFCPIQRFYSARDSVKWVWWWRQAPKFKYIVRVKHWPLNISSHLMVRQRKKKKKKIAHLFLADVTPATIGSDVKDGLTTYKINQDFQ